MQLAVETPQTAAPRTTPLTERFAPPMSIFQPARPCDETLAKLPILEVVRETNTLSTIRLDNAAASLSRHRPGQALEVQFGEGGPWHRLDISSSPTQPGVVDVAVRAEILEGPGGYRVRPKRTLAVRGPTGPFYFAPSTQTEPLLLIATGGSAAPLVSIMRFLLETENDTPCTCLIGAKTLEDVAYYDTCLDLEARLAELDYLVTLTEPTPERIGPAGELDFELVSGIAPDVAERRCFVCGPAPLVTPLSAALLQAGVPRPRIHTWITAEHRHAGVLG